ncbi:MAG TPA: DUF5686 family protein, partial [Segetibacter sp.]
MRQKLLFILIVCTTAGLQAQTFKLTGRITNASREAVAFVSVQVKELQSGVVTKENGAYTLLLEAGKYDIVYSIVGYKPQVLTITITKDYIQNVILEEDLASLENVTIRSKYKDPSVNIIRSVIRHKDSLIASVGAYSTDVYIKAVQQDSSTKQQRVKAKKDSVKINPYKDIAGMAFTEVFLKLDFSGEQKIKEERAGVKKLGNTTDLFYLSSTEGSFNFYNNLVKVPALSNTPFISPVSYSGLLAYKFKTINVEKRGAYKWYTISVKPRLISNATVEGELTINDSTYTIEHTRFSFPKYHLPQYDFFEVEQWYLKHIPV